MSKAIRYIFVLLAAALLVPALAQDADADTFDAEDYGILGDVDIGAYEPLNDNFENAALHIVATTPTNQTANVNVVGPDDYLEHLEVDENGEAILDDLQPGIYSVAATDDGLQLAETKVEVRPDQMVTVTLNLKRLPGAPFDPADFNANRYRPFGNFRVGTYDTYANNDAGAITVDAPDDGIDFLITGPNGYSDEFSGDATLDTLVPGVYSIAGTADGRAMTETKVVVEAAKVVSAVPVLVAYVPGAAGRAQGQTGGTTGGTMTGGATTGGATGGAGTGGMP